MDKLRLRFEKTGRAVWISHLDLMHTMQRGFSRAGIRLQYSEGFNPHPIMSIAMPLSVGAESECELMDIRIAGDFNLEALNRSLPEGIKVLEAYEPERKIADIRWLAIRGTFEPCDDEAVNAFFAQDSIRMIKKTKRGEAETDIKPMIQSFAVKEGVLEAVISAQNPTLNPNCLVEALEQCESGLAPDFYRFRRMELYDADGKVFR